MSKQQLIDAIKEHYKHIVGIIEMRCLEDVINKHMEGMVIVPEEPTDAMILASRDKLDTTGFSPPWRDVVASDVYRAMLQAAKEQS